MVPTYRFQSALAAITVDDDDFILGGDLPDDIDRAEQLITHRPDHLRRPGEKQLVVLAAVGARSVARVPKVRVR